MGETPTHPFDIFEVMNMGTMNGAILYCRVSTQRQAENGVSLDVQAEKLRAYCVAKDIPVAAVIYEQGVSGTIALGNRPGGREVLEAIRQGADHVAAYKLDRLFRSAQDALSQVNAWVQQEVKLHLLDINLDTSTPTGKFILHILAGVAEMDNEQRAERIREAMANKKAKLLKYTGRVYGFVLCDDGETLARNMSELEVVARMNALRAMGQTFRGICDTLNAGNVAAPNGGQWHPETVRRILNNDIYNKQSA